MRLIDAQRFLDGAADFFVETDERDYAPYAIVSHRWGDEELSYDDAKHIRKREDLKLRKGYAKIRNACKQALEDNLFFVWCDTCCIDKSSSAELQEAINSM